MTTETEQPTTLSVDDFAKFYSLEFNETYSDLLVWKKIKLESPYTNQSVDLTFYPKSEGSPLLFITLYKDKILSVRDPRVKKIYNSKHFTEQTLFEDKTFYILHSAPSENGSNLTKTVCQSMILTDQEGDMITTISTKQILALFLNAKKDENGQFIIIEYSLLDNGG
ncbi:hypothetical protein IT417_03530 [bacterium]|nr:hypothetical protein [bacterium]